MNNQRLIIVIIVLLIVLVSFLINKNLTDSFSNGNCNDFNINICQSSTNPQCRVLGNACKYTCMFNPASTDASTDASAYGMVTKPVGDGVEFESEPTLGPYQACYEKCIQHADSSNPTPGFCKVDECRSKCREYVTSINSQHPNIRYNNYPTNQIGGSEYDNIKSTVLSKMVAGNYTEEIKNAIYGGDISEQVEEYDDVGDKIDQLQHMFTSLQDLSSTGNNFIQQVDQMGAFQDKYSSKIDSVLNEKRNNDSGIDRQLLNLNRKMETLSDLYRGYTQTGVPAARAAVNYYKTATSISNGNKLTFRPVTYTDAIGDRKIYQNGAYLINLSKGSSDPISGDRFLYIEPLKYTSTGDVEFCNPKDLSCNYQLTDGTDRPEDEEITLINTSEVIIKKEYKESDFTHKKQAYFNVIKITNNDEYNSIIIKSPNGSRNLVKTNEIIRYPFYVIQSIELPGYLISITNNVPTDPKIELNPADKRGPEKFDVDFTNYDATCN